MTDNEKNSVLVSGSILPTVPNTPTRAGERIATIAEMENIQNPSIGMTIYVEDEGVFYYVTALKSKEINGVTIVNAVIDTYEYAYGKKITTDTPDDELPEDGENPDNGETPDEGGDGTQEPTPEIPGGSTGTTNTTLDALPVGTIMRFNQAPDEKWLPCDGSLVQQEDYPELNCPELNSTDFTDTEGKYITTAGNIKICCSDDVFVIMVGTNNLCYSEDKCKTWNSVNIPTDQYSGTTIISQYVNGMFFFITDTGYCAASGNGKDWNFSKFPNTMNIAHIIYWDNKYRIPSVGNTYHFASDDGISWSAVGNLNNITVYDFAVDNTGMLWCLSSSAVYFRYAFSSSWSNISNTYLSSTLIYCFQDKRVLHVPGSSTCRISNDDSLNFVEKSLSYAAYGQLFEYDDKIFSSTTMWDNSFNLKKQWTMGYNFNNNAVSGCVNKNGVYFVYNSLIINTTDLENIRVMNHYMSSSNTTLTKDVSYGDVHCFLTSSNAYGLDENGYVKYVNNNTSNRLFYDLFVTPDGIFGIGASLYHTSNGINWVTSSLGVSNTSKLFYINGTYYITNGSTIRKGTYNDIMNNTHKNISGVSHNYSYSDGKNIVFCSDTTAYIYDFKTDSCVPVLRNASSIKSVAHTDKKYFIFDTGVVHVFNNDFNYIKTVTCPITLTNVISFDNNIFGKNNNNYYSFNENGDCLSIGSSPSNSELRCYEDGIYFVSNGCKIKCELINQGIVLPKLEEYSYIKAL